MTIGALDNEMFRKCFFKNFLQFVNKNIIVTTKMCCNIKLSITYYTCQKIVSFSMEKDKFTVISMYLVMHMHKVPTIKVDKLY